MRQQNKITSLAICAAIILFFCGCGKNPITEFSADNWKSVEQDQRYHMLEDLYAKVELIGMSADEVEELLGISKSTLIREVNKRKVEINEYMIAFKD